MCEMPKCINTLHRKARKRHRCCECYGFIEKGETYEYVSGVWDKPESFKTCRDCENERERVINELKPNYEDFPPFGYLYENLTEWSDEDFLRVIENRKKRSAQIWHWMDKHMEDMMKRHERTS